MQNTLVGRYQTEAYATWIKRQCARIGEPWKPEYAIPLDGPAFGPLAKARQDRALAKMRGRAE